MKPHSRPAEGGNAKAHTVESCEAELTAQNDVNHREADV